MGLLREVFLIALSCLQFVHGLPISPTPETYPQESRGVLEEWGAASGIYASLPALALIITTIGLLLGCTWCHRSKDCKLFSTSATHLQDVRANPPDSGFSEPVNNNISEDNNNGPISFREMQNIANNNAAAYIVSENEQRNRGRESVVEFEPLPARIGAADPLEHCADWFRVDDFPRNRLQYLREIGRGWFGRIVEGEIEDGDTTSAVAVKILTQNASLEDKARFLDEGKIFRDVTHENILAYIGKCVSEDPWILMFELCSMDLRQYLAANHPKMAILNEAGVPLRLMCDVTAALAHLHSRGYVYGNLWSGNVLMRGNGETARAVLGQYVSTAPEYGESIAPETRQPPYINTPSSEIWSAGWLIWEICSWGSGPPRNGMPPPPDLPCPYRNHLYQVMQLCWNINPEVRPTSAQVHALLNHLFTTHTHVKETQDDGYSSSDFEERWQRLKPNAIPKVDEHVAIVHAPSTSTRSHFTGSDQDFDNTHTIQDTLSVDLDTAVSRSSSIMSDKDALSVQVKSESLTNLHGSYEDVRNIYLTHNETPLLECNQANTLEDHSDSSVDPWLKDIIAGSQDDVSYFKDVSDVIKNLDNILNSEKTSSSESSHQASPSRDNLSLDCKKDYQMQSTLVKSPGINNFKNILESGFDKLSDDMCDEDDADRDTVGTLSHSFERHSDTASQHTLANLTPETPSKGLDDHCLNENQTVIVPDNCFDKELNRDELPKGKLKTSVSESPVVNNELITTKPSVSEHSENYNVNKDCKASCDSLTAKSTNKIETKSIENVVDSKNYNIDQNKDILITETFNQVNLNHEKNVTKETNHKLQPYSLENITGKLQESNLLSNCDSSNTKDNVQIIFDNFSTHHDAQKQAVSDNIISETSNHSIQCFHKPNNESIDKLSEIKGVAELTLKQIFELATQSLEAKSKLNCSQNIDEQNKNLYISENNTFKGSCSNVNRSDSCTEILNQAVLKESFDDSTVYMDLTSNSNFDTNQHNYTDRMTFDMQLSDYDPQSSEKVSESKNESTIYLDLPNTNQETQNFLNVERAMNEMNNYINTSTPKGSVNSSDNTLDNSLEEENSEEVLTENIDPDFGQNCSLTKQKQQSLLESAISPMESPTESHHTDTVVAVVPVCSQDYMLIKSDQQECSLTHEKLPTESDYTDVIEAKLLDCGPGYALTKFEVQELPESSFILGDIDGQPQADTIEPKISDYGPVCSFTEKQNMLASSLTSEESPTKSHHKDVIEAKVPDYGPGYMLTKLEQQCVPESVLSPMESPTKSLHTDTYDENSSVVLGPFENCTLDLFKAAKSNTEEVMTFSSNFSDINLETPSPLRDSNFLNEVPDIVHEDFDDLAAISESKTDFTDPETDIKEGTEKRAPPSTPPNSPGNFLATVSQEKYIVDIDLTPSASEPVNDDAGFSSLHDEIDLNQIEITTKLAMAENENNLNLEYSGPLTVEGLVVEEGEVIPESVLAGNGSLDEFRVLSLDDDCMRALRNELELKLPLAQVASIEPECEDNDGSWSGSLPPPPELIVNYPGALSPIAEETGMQLNAYENDTPWMPSIRTDSSESYLEPCNLSTDEVTDLPTFPSGVREATYTINSDNNTVNNTYTVLKDNTSSKENTMSADSLNAIPSEKVNDSKSPIDDRTYVKDDLDQETNCERISQVSPFILSPTEASLPEISDNVTGVSTISKNSSPTDAKLSKPSETQCQSKSTSIDSWCSNDTLYNVEENFDDLALDPAVPDEFKTIKTEDKCDSERTLNNEDEKDESHCSTYIIHDSKSDHDSFSQDSITANDNQTFTKLKAEAVMSEKGDSTKNTQTKDLAYGTVVLAPSYSNCTTEAASAMEEVWRLPQPELVRKSPVPNDFQFTPPKQNDDKTNNHESPLLTNEPNINRIESVDLSCLRDESINNAHVEKEGNNMHFQLQEGQFSTPFTVVEDEENIYPIPLQLPNSEADISDINGTIPNIQTFLESAEGRPHDTYFMSPDDEVLLEGSSASKINDRETLNQSFHTFHQLHDLNFENTADVVNSASNNVGESTGLFFPGLSLQNPTNPSFFHMTDDLNDTVDEQIITNVNVTPSMPETSPSSLPSFNAFQDSVVLKAQEMSAGQNNSTIDSNILDKTDVKSPDCLPSFTAFQNSAVLKAQEMSTNTTSDSNNTVEVLQIANVYDNAEKNKSTNSLPSFDSFQNSAVLKAQEMSSDTNSESRNLESTSIHSNSDDHQVQSEPLPSYSGFQSSAVLKAQELSNIVNNGFQSNNSFENIDESLQSTTHSKNLETPNEMEKSVDMERQIINNSDNSTCHNHENGNADDFEQFEDMIKKCPQDMSSLLDASNQFLRNERLSSSLAMNFCYNHASQSESRVSDVTECLDVSPPNNNTNLLESHLLENQSPGDIIQLNVEEDTDQPHSLILIETPKYPTKEVIPSKSGAEQSTQNATQENTKDVWKIKPNNGHLETSHKHIFSPNKTEISEIPQNVIVNHVSLEELVSYDAKGTNDIEKAEKLNGTQNIANFATVSFLSEPYEELVESNVDDHHDTVKNYDKSEDQQLKKTIKNKSFETSVPNGDFNVEKIQINGKSITEDFLSKEKQYCQLETCIPLLGDIRFTELQAELVDGTGDMDCGTLRGNRTPSGATNGPTSEIMSTSFNDDTPTDQNSPDTPKDASERIEEMIKDWDSDSDSHSTNSSSGEFIWKDGDGHETEVVPSTYFEHQRGNGTRQGESTTQPQHDESGGSDGGDSGSGSEGDEVEFVPSSWDSSAAPSKSSLRSLEQAPPDNKKRVVFKRQKYHCVYEYPREVVEVDTQSPAYMPDLSTYCDWDASNAEEAELIYGHLFGSPQMMFGHDYADYGGFVISSSARPFETLGYMCGGSEFFPGKASLLEGDLEDPSDDLPPPPSPLANPPPQTTPSLDFTTPDSGVEDITPGSTEEEFKKKLTEVSSWRPTDSESSSESVSPSSPGGEALGGLRHTRDKLKLDLPPSPHVSSPRHNRVFNFVLDKPKRHRQIPDEPKPLLGTTPLVMTDETPIVTTNLPVEDSQELQVPEPTFSTFGKSESAVEPEQKIVLTGEADEQIDVKEDVIHKTETVKGEGTVLDSGDEDSGIESSSKATLERNKPTPNIS